MPTYDVKVSLIIPAEDPTMARMKAEDVIDNTDYQYLLHEIELLPPEEEED